MVHAFIINMYWILIAIVIVIVFVKRGKSLTPQQTRLYLKEGAVIVDVRNPDEFQREHLPGAKNIPLGVIKEEAGRSLTDKNQVILLHCVSGMRSAIAARILKQQGYAKAFNLGSYTRAEKFSRTSEKE
jgi:phage shock protein E